MMIYNHNSSICLWCIYTHCYGSSIGICDTISSGVAARRAAKQEITHELAMADLERMRTTPGSNRQRLMARLVESKRVLKEGNTKSSVDNETIVDTAPSG